MRGNQPLAPLKPPAVYQGAKQKIAGKILDVIDPKLEQPFWDLCCGSGAITCELLNRGFKPEQITMVDSGPWALFWQEISDGSFDINRLRTLIARLPKDPNAIGFFLKGLAAGAKTWDAPTFLLLQAGSYRCKAVGFNRNPLDSYGLDGTFKLPGVNGDGLRPHASEILSRVEALMERGRGLNVLRLDVREVHIPPGATVYVDPPYSGTTGYAGKLDGWKPNRPVWMSEGKPLGPTCYLIQQGRETNFRKHAADEWITLLLPTEFIRRVNGAADYVLPSEA